MAHVQEHRPVAIDAERAPDLVRGCLDRAEALAVHDGWHHDARPCDGRVPAPEPVGREERDVGRAAGRRPLRVIGGLQDGDARDGLRDEARERSQSHERGPCEA